jgi:hypothetical protein
MSDFLLLKNQQLSISVCVDMPSLDSVGSSSLEEFSRRHHGNLPPWEKKLVAAQNVLFNQELFTMVTTIIMRAS